MKLKIMEQKVFPAAKGLIYNEKGEFLVIRQIINGKEFWDIPGGKIDSHETPIETLKREVKEETNLEVEPYNCVGVWWFDRIKDGNRVICITYECKLIGGDMNQINNPSEAEKKENIEFKWVTKGEFAKDKYHLERSNSSLQDLINSL